MTEEENEKIAICPVCLESLTTDLYFTSDDYLYHQTRFFIFFTCKQTSQWWSLFWKKNIKNNFRIIYNLDGFDVDGFSKEGFDRNGFNRIGIDEYGYNINK